MSSPTTDLRPRLRLAGACGVAGTLLLLAAPSLDPQGIGVTVWIVGWLVLVPFFAGLATLARSTGGGAAWLAPAVTMAGAVLAAVHLVNAGVEQAANGLPTSSPTHDALHAVGSALFSLAMLPLGVALIAAAAAGLAGRCLPRWLSGTAGIIGVVALVNGTMVGSEAAWGFLLPLLWVFAAGSTLVVRPPRPAGVPDVLVRAA